MLKLEALKLSVQHWKRMIRYMKEHGEEPASDVAMLESIGEFWSTRDCALCDKYSSVFCRGCPLVDKKRGGTCTPSYHIFVEAVNLNISCAGITPTWSSVLVHAKSVLRRLQKEYKKAREEV